MVLFLLDMALMFFFLSLSLSVCFAGHGWNLAAAAWRFNYNQLKYHWPPSGLPGIFTRCLFVLWIQLFILKLQLLLVDKKKTTKKKTNNPAMRRRQSGEEPVKLLIWMNTVSQTRKDTVEKAPKWRRNPKRPQGLDGKRRTVNFMNWPKCCLYRRPSPPSWTKPPS